MTHKFINLQREYYADLGGGLTGNAENIKKALESRIDMFNYLRVRGDEQIRLDILAYAQSIRAEHKQPDRVEIWLKFAVALAAQSIHGTHNIPSKLIPAARELADEFIKQSKQTP